MDRFFTCTNWPTPGGRALAYLYKNGVAIKFVGFAPCQSGANNVLMALPPNLVPASDYQLALYWETNMAVKAFGGRFTVTPAPTLTITSPTTGTLWQAGTSRNVTYTCTNWPTPGGRALVYLYKNGALSMFLGFLPCQNGANSVPLTMPTGLTTGADYPVSLSWTTNPAVGTQSVNFTAS